MRPTRQAIYRDSMILKNTPKTILISAVLAILVSGCSMFSGSSTGEVRVVEEEEIEIDKVYISKERAQCEDESGRTLDQTKAMLQDDGIKVYNSVCALITGKMSPALCGRSTLHINIHGIDERKFEEAEELGFKPLASLEDEDLGYDTSACD